MLAEVLEYARYAGGGAACSNLAYYPGVNSSHSTDLPITRYEHSRRCIMADRVPSTLRHDQRDRAPVSRCLAWMHRAVRQDYATLAVTSSPICSIAMIPFEGLRHRRSPAVARLTGPNTSRA